jgi:hypothetical protein
MSPHGHFPRKLLALVALLLLVPSGTALGSQTYADSPGDAPGGAPDITSVAISHKLAGDVTFKVAFANRSTGDDLVIVGIDSDQNRGLGTPTESTGRSTSRATLRPSVGSIGGMPRTRPVSPRCPG